MKVRAAGRSRKIVLEAGAQDAALPPISVPELQLRKILVPVDFSECSRKAVHYAASFAKQFNAEVVLLHVLEVIAVEGQVVATGTREAAEQELFQLRKEFAYPGSTKTVIREGTGAHHGIVLAAGDLNCDLIIIGNHGRSGLARMLLGNTAEKVIRNAPCPVLVIREREHDFIGQPESSASQARPGAAATIRGS
jgi:universal stress protein A